MRENTDNDYYQLTKYVINIDFLAFNHKTTTLMYLEDIFRYSSYYKHEPGFVQQIVPMFFSSRAIYSNDI
jgi:hypothetical protein